MFGAQGFRAACMKSSTWKPGGKEASFLSAEDAYSSMASDPTFAFVGGLCCPTLDLEIAFWIMIYVLHIVNFAILYPHGY